MRGAKNAYTGGPQGTPKPASNVVQYSALCVLLFASFAVTQTLHSEHIVEAVNVDDLSARIRIPVVSLAPNGSHVAYMTVEAVVSADMYEIRLYVLNTDGIASPIPLDQYQLPADEVFDRDSGEILKNAGQIVWSPDSRQLVYSTHAGARMAAKVKQLATGHEGTLLGGFEKVEITPQNNELHFITTNHLEDTVAEQRQPNDLSLLIKDGYRFFGSLRNPKSHGKYVVQHWDYNWGTVAPTKAKEADVTSYLPVPEEWTETRTALGVRTRTGNTETLMRNPVRSPDGSLAAVTEDSTHNLRDPVTAYRASQIVLEDLRTEKQQGRILVPSESPRAGFRILGWDHSGKELYYLNLGPRFSSLNAVSISGERRELYKEQSAFVFSDPISEISDDSRTVVFVRTTNLVPDELVKVDLVTRALTVLSSPNERFKTKIQPSVRFVSIECCDADFYGRLYLPAHYDKDKRYPLVFTNYVSGPGFDASVGDEVPILALLQHGIAVFAMNSREANITSAAGDFRFEISRVDKPRRAMEWVYSTLVAQGIVMPGEVGLTGLSYGAEIAMYSYWKSNIFRAVSVSTASWEPMNYVTGGIRYAEFLDSRGFVLPEDGTYGKWKELSAGLNARPDLPPLLIQSPDGEEHFGTIETWFRLRQVGAAVEWYEYPNEGHVKRGPANKWWVYERNLDWFRFWLKGEEDADPEKKEQFARWREFQKLKGQQP